VNQDALPQDVRAAVQAAQSKFAFATVVLDLRELRAFTGYFLICSGASTPQVQAIAEEIEARLEAQGRRVQHREGGRSGQWLLLDYGSFVAHIFHEQARQFYDLERLWRSAARIEIPDDRSRAAS
jgi:ribosome-associated protein